MAAQTPVITDRHNSVTDVIVYMSNAAYVRFCTARLSISSHGEALTKSIMLLPVCSQRCLNVTSLYTLLADYQLAL
jgi:hypothetical protein